MARVTNNQLTSFVFFDNQKSKRVYPFFIDPVIPVQLDDLYVVTVAGDRLDSLAYQYYSDATLWWIIAAANPELRKDSVFLDLGIQLRIPVNHTKVINLFVDANLSR